MVPALTLLSLVVSQAAPVAPASPPELLSDRLLLPTYSWDIVGGRLSVRRASDDRLLEDSLTADGLAQLLAASPRAAGLARDAHGDLQWGYALKYGGLLGALAGAVGVTIGAAQTTDGNAQLAWTTAGGTLFFAGVVATVFGVIGINQGFARAMEAVGVYDRELLLRGAGDRPP